MTLPAQVVRFVLVGCAAAATHFAVVWLLVEHAATPALLANIGGWAIAFGVSFAGHFGWTFAGHGAPLLRSARRFVMVSLAGFAINEACYAALLNLSSLDYRTALAIVLVSVAAGTFLLGRLWAFRGDIIPSR